MLIARAGLADFHPASSGYRCGDLHAQLIPLSEIQVPTSRTLVVEERANAILVAINQSAPLPPVEVDEPPSRTATSCRYRLRDGFHRYHLSAALGFTHIPVAIKPFFDWNDL
ncbi:hypothetical protein [Rhodanobacter hydrolyticus]|uniref:ParB/Sulfiredoxin domain-containing protein n=1 Tax=Rhodanobacter hydrolyticus TaxID=2250595 RepID=A0ABW8J5F9_9GAMM